VWGLSLLNQRMTAALRHGDPQEASIALVLGRYFLAGTVLLLLIQTALCFPPREVAVQARRRMVPLLAFFVLTELVWLGWALAGFGQSPSSVSGAPRPPWRRGRAHRQRRATFPATATRARRPRHMAEYPLAAAPLRRRLAVVPGILDCRLYRGLAVAV